MHLAPTVPGSFADRVRRLDARLCSASPSTRVIAIVLTLGLMLWQAVPQVPRAYIDYSHLAVLHRFTQPDGFGPDTIGDGYEAKVVLHDLSDMYTKTRLEQTPTEAATWTKRTGRSGQAGCDHRPSNAQAKQFTNEWIK